MLFELAFGWLKILIGGWPAMPKKKYIVDLADTEREELQQLLRAGKHPTRKVTRAFCSKPLTVARTNRSLPRLASGGRGWNAHGRVLLSGVWQLSTSGLVPASSPSSMSKQRLACLPRLAAMLPKAKPAGRCNCSLTGWSSWRSSRQSRMRPFAGRSKKPAQAVVERAVVHSNGQ